MSPPSPPASQSPLLVSARTTFDPHLHPSTLLPTLKTLSHRLQQAQHHTKSFPPLHSRLQRTSLATLRLADRTYTTLTAFRTACLTSLDNLDLLHHLTLQNPHQPTVAKSLLSTEANTASRLASQSHTLALQFEETAVTLAETLSLAAEIRHAQQQRQQLLTKRVADGCVKLQHARNDHVAAQRTLTEAGELYKQAENREERARWKVNVLQMANAAVMVGSVVSTRSSSLGWVGMGSAAVLAASADGAVMRAREERAVHLKTKMDAREDMMKSGREVAELKEMLKGVREEEGVAGVVLEGIEGAVQALRVLAGEMLKAEGFWRAVGEGMRGGGEVAGEVGLGWDVFVGGRMQERIGVVQARWMVLKGVCEECIKGVEQAKVEMEGKVGYEEMDDGGMMGGGVGAEAVSGRWEQEVGTSVQPG